MLLELGYGKFKMLLGQLHVSAYSRVQNIDQ